MLLCAALLTDVAIAAPTTLQSVAVTPAVRSLSVGQKQRYTATGTFSDGSTHTLGAAVADVAPGNGTTCILLTSGGVDCWGENDLGQVGDGTTTDSLIPRPVKWITQATAVGRGYDHHCALLARGAVRCWGMNMYGQLGNGTRTNATKPVTVAGINSATALALGSMHSCALVSSGEVLCWGSGYGGQLGNGTLALSTRPVAVTGISTATALGLGYEHSCAVLNSGEVQCWGQNYYGQLGNGTGAGYSTTPVNVSGIDNATAIASGSYFSCALLSNGAVKCWGAGPNGELGNGQAPWYSSTPVDVVGISTAVAITTGNTHACAVLSNGSALCWGDNGSGELGNGLMTAYTSSTPVQVLQISSPVRLAAGFGYTCALLTDGAMRCWGRDAHGELGDRRRTGSTPTRWPVNVVGTPGVVWESSDPAKATISIRGRATAHALGNVTITATTAGFINDNAVLTVK